MSTYLCKLPRFYILVSIFLPCDAMLSWYMLLSCVCVSVASWCSTKMAQLMELIFGIEASFCVFYTMLWGNLGNSKNNGTCFWDFVLHCELRKFCHCKSILGAVNEDEDGEVYSFFILFIYFFYSHRRRFTTVDCQCNTHAAYSLLGLQYECVVTRTSHIPSVAVESREPVDRISE